MTVAEEPLTLDGGRWGSWKGQSPRGACLGPSLTPSTPLHSRERKSRGDLLTLALQWAGDRKPVSTTTAYSWWPGGASSCRKM